METSQIIALVVLLLLLLVGYIGSIFAKSNEARYNYILITVITTIISLGLLLASFMECNMLRKKAEGKCPEYQKIENAYQLKQ